nr:uncharacterized protein LOC109415949 [Aedes albopictus]
MVLVHCVFDKCGNQRKKNGKISFFSFPKEPDLLQKWINFINTHNPTKLSEQALDRERMKICHMHFEKNQVATKSNSDRVLVRNSVPRCPPGIVDKAHALKTSKPNKKSKKTKESKSSNSQASKPGAAANAQSKNNSPIVEGPPLYHTINGYVVDLRIAALQETFRLPNGKLIQVRRQPKKGSETEQEASTKLPTQQPSQPKSPVVSNASPIVQPPRSKPVQSKEPVVNGLPDSSTSVPRPAQGTPNNLPTPPTSAHNTKASKTYINRRSGNPPVRTTAPSFRIAETRGPVVYPPSLSSLQSLMHKVHANTPFGNQLKDFEDRMITIAEISLHVVCKLNNLLNSNPYKNAAESRDIKYLYHTIGYLLEYAVGRFNDMEQTCVTDIINMGFTSKCDLGPLQNKQAEQPPADIPPTEKTPSEQQPTPTEEQPTSSNDNPPTSTEKDKTPTNSDEEQPLPTKKANEEKTSEQPQSEVSEADEPDDEDDDCAIIEPRTDIIEVYSDDESDEPDDDGKSGAQTAEPASISINPRQLRICSDTESVDRGDESTSDSDKSSEKTAPPKKQSNDGKDKQTNVKERPESGSKEVQATVEETTEIEVVMNEVEETTIVHDYYYEAYTDDDDDDGDVVQVQQDVVETMEVDDDDDENDSSSRERQDGEEEETEELIEIIEGDVDLDLEDGQEYKVIEVVEGDFDNW